MTRISAGIFFGLLLGSCATHQNVRPHGMPQGDGHLVHEHGPRCGHVRVDGEWLVEVGGSTSRARPSR